MNHVNIKLLLLPAWVRRMPFAASFLACEVVDGDLATGHALVEDNVINGGEDPMCLRAASGIPQQCLKLVDAIHRPLAPEVVLGLICL